MLPYDAIIETGTRRWTGQLLARLDAPDLADDELRQVQHALAAASDHRSFAALDTILRDPSRPPRLREAAGAALRGMHHVVVDVPAETLRHRWDHGDDVLRRAALRGMGQDCPDIVRAVAVDDNHPWQADALERMAFWFETADDETLKIRGLTHADEFVREAAAWVLLWDEPVAAEEPLLRATHDLSERVARQAIDTLRYYPTRRVLTRLHELRERPDGKYRADVEDAFANVRDDLLHGVGLVRAWLAPVWDILEVPEEEPPPVYHPAQPELPAQLPLQELLALLADHDTAAQHLSDTLRQVDWDAYQGAARERLRRVLLTHPDQIVRDSATRALAAWGDAAGLLEQLDDPSYGVRKSATYHLGTLPASPAIAEVVWAYFAKRGCLGTHGTEALQTLVHHAASALALERLTPLALNRSENSCLRLAAIGHLNKLGAVEVLTSLLPELAEPPAVTWAIPIALLGAIRNLGLPAPDVRHLAEVDNLDVQIALAEFREA